MKISIDWIADFVDLNGVSAEELEDRLTVHTAEVEGVEVVRRRLDGLVVGEVRAMTPIDAGGKLRHWVQVELGGGQSASTVCGAPNVRVGMRVVFAPVGSTLQNGDAVAATMLYGHRSEGVLCAPGEIGLGTTKEGLLEVPPSVAVGTAVRTLIASEECLVEIDNKSLTHRPDLWGHYGFARELSAIFRRPLRPYLTAALPLDASLPLVPIEVEDATDCPVYSALGFAVADNPVSPLRVQARLLALGHTPINALVDVTNYVQFELGQPTHAFDARALRRPRVARSGQPRSFATLDGKSWSLQPDDLLIWDGDRPVALAGIMGGADSRIQPDTRALVLESATFRAARVRATSVRLGLRTDSSLRFEKKPPPVYTQIAAGRVLHHLEAAGLRPVPTARYSLVGDTRDVSRTITLAPGWLSKRAGAELPESRVDEILSGLGFGVARSSEGAIEVTVPSFRSVADLSIPEDISEEVMRLYGYDNLVPVPPKGPLAPVAPHAATRAHHRARRILSEGHAFVEVQTYAWHADDWLATLGYAPAHPAVIRNPIAPTRRQMRDTLVPNLLAAAHQNRHHAEHYRLYELGRTFWLDAAGVKHEADELAGVIVDQSGASADVSLRAARSALEDVAAAAGLGALRFVPADSGPPWLRRGRSLAVSHAGGPVGFLGVLPDNLNASVLGGGHTVWFVASTAALQGEAYPTARYVAPPQFPGSWQDFTFVWPVASGFAGLADALDGFGHALVERREFVTMYQPKGADTANYSFRYLLRAPERTATQADLDGFRSEFLAFVGAKGLRIG